MSEIKPSPESNCFLCEKRKVSPRKSHFTPRSASESLFGEKDTEEIYAFSLHEPKIETFFGRSNPKNEDPTLKKQPNIEGNVFCKECEENLGKIEAIVTPILNGESLKNLRHKRTARFNKYIEIPVHPNIFSLYLYSVVWRQDFEQQLRGQSKILGDDYYDKIRNCVANLIELPTNEISNTNLIKDLPDTICVSCLQDTSPADSTNPHPVPTNPEVFHMGKYDCLVFKTSTISPYFKARTGLKFNPKDPDVFVNKSKTSRILIIDKVSWEQKQHVFFRQAVDKKMSFMIEDVAIRNSVSLTEARWMLHKTAQKIAAETLKPPFYALDEAFERLMK